MLSRTGVLAAATLVLWSASSATAADRLVRPCASDDPAHRTAAAELEAIDVAVKALGPAADPNDEAADHAVRLLQIAEEAFLAGCPQGRPPAWITEPQPRLSAHKLDSDDASLTLAARNLAAGWREALARQGSCEGPSRP
jgi:hypothetical protein